MKETSQKQNTETLYRCNGCGKRIAVQEEMGEDYLLVEKQWGYFSQNKDGLCHRFRLCETCYDRLLAGFVIPAEETELTEWQ